MKFVCNWCGKEFDAPKSAKRKFCQMDCCYKFQSKKNNPNGYHKRPHLLQLNKELNPTRMTDDVKAKLSLRKLGNGNQKSYQKLKGRHVHRTIAEMVIGRKLEAGEIVHHIDGNKRNNHPSNLEVIKNQSQHAFLHVKRRLDNEC